jgi:3-hydroxy-3-methylglutaryl CoA synthase
VRAAGIASQLDGRHALDWEQYQQVLEAGRAVRFGTCNAQIDREMLPAVWQTIRERIAASGQPRIFLERIEGFHRRYAWAD